MDHRIVHFEVPAENPAALSKFYGELFGWKVEKVPVPGFDYWTCRTGEGPGIDGGIVKRTHAQHQITNYVNVEQLDAMLARAQALGAQVAVPRSPVPNMGWFAIVLDPQGNPLGFWQTDKDAK